MSGPSQRFAPLWAIAVLSLLPGCMEAYAVLWGAAQGYTGKALRDGLDFWAGATLAAHHQAQTVFNPQAYTEFLATHFGPNLPTHLWSYPPNYLLLAAGFGHLPPWPAVLSFDAATLFLLIFILRLAALPWLLVLAVAFSPVSLENLLEGQNAALLTALIAGGILLTPTRPRLAGALIGLATIKPQLGMPLPVFLLRTPLAFAWAILAALLLGLASLRAFGCAAWSDFWHITRPAMDNVLFTGQPPAFAGGLISVFAAIRALGVPLALAIQTAVTIICVRAGHTKNPACVLILCCLASPYLHVYDLLPVTLAVALLIRDRLATGFTPGEPILFFLAWAGPGALPWLPQFAHFTPAILALLLASAARHDRVRSCDSPKLPSSVPASSAGPSPIPAPHACTAPGSSVTASTANTTSSQSNREPSPLP